MHPCGGVVSVVVVVVFQVSIRPEQLQENISSLSQTRWDEWANAVIANTVRNLKAEELHCFSVLGNLTVTSHEIF